jgi:hypothetical protein
MKMIRVPKQFITYDDNGKPVNMDILGWLLSMPMKNRLGTMIYFLQKIQEQQYKGFKKFLKNTPGSSNLSCKESFEAIGRMYYVIHSMMDDYKKL